MIIKLVNCYIFLLKKYKHNDDKIIKCIRIFFLSFANLLLVMLCQVYMTALSAFKPNFLAEHFSCLPLMHASHTQKENTSILRFIGIWQLPLLDRDVSSPLTSDFSLNLKVKRGRAVHSLDFDSFKLNLAFPTRH